MPQPFKRHSKKPIVNFNPRITIKGGREEEEELEEGEEEEEVVPPKKKGAVEYEEVKIGGKTFKVEKGGAAAVAALAKRSGGDETAVLRKMLEDLMAAQKATPKKKAKVEEEEEAEEEFDEAEFFTNPGKFLKKFGANLSKSIMEQIGTAYNSDQTLKSFWKSFYDENDDLKDHDVIVQSVLNKHAKELGVMSTEDGAAELAKRARQELLNIAKKVSKGVGKNNKFVVEGRGPSRNGQVEEQEEEDQDEVDKKAGRPMTMSALLKLRREKRRAHVTNNAEAAEE